MGKLVAGVGVNDADYKVVRFGEYVNGKRKREWICPYYRAWSAMLNRCYRQDNDDRYNAYKDVIVCTEWHTFSVFKSWMEKQDWEGKVLDKDLLTGNCEYSPDNCLFIPAWLNTAITGSKKRSSTQLIGILKIRGLYYVHTSLSNVLDSTPFTDVLEAIHYYHAIKTHYIETSNLCEDLKAKALNFFDRRKSGHLEIVSKFTEEFPARTKGVVKYNVPSVGDRYKTAKGYWYEILEVNNAEDIIIQFEDGSVRSVRNSRIADGSIRKPTTEKESFRKVKERIDKVFKWNSHGLISGVQLYSSDLYGVAYKEGDKSRCFYTKSIKEALDFRESTLRDRVSKIVKSDPTQRDKALKYFTHRWENEVVRYCGMLPPTS